MHQLTMLLSLEDAAGTRGVSFNNLQAHLLTASHVCRRQTGHTSTIDQHFARGRALHKAKLCRIALLRGNLQNCM